MRLLEPIEIGGRRAPSRLMFGPHVTNLGDDDRSITDRHVAYYAARARGGCGVIVIEGASVHESDWPYERAPLAERCVDGWKSVAEAVHEHGALVIASLDHAGGQGSSAYSQRPLWAPSRVPEVNSREVPKWMEESDIAAVIQGFSDAAAGAVAAGLDGVEINAGQHSLVRQFMSGLTNHRGDQWGADKLLFARTVIASVRQRIDLIDGPKPILGLRLSCDELAPWAGITLEMAPGIAAELCAAGVDYVVVVRGAIFSAEKTRPDFHEPTGFNIDVCRSVKAAVPDSVRVFLQGSIVDVGQAEWALQDDVCDAVEMTRAHIADPEIALKVQWDKTDRIRPCLRCNQACQVRDARNPIVSCVVEPSSGHEKNDPHWYDPTSMPRKVLVIGAGPAGLEAARVAATRGHQVTVAESTDLLGGMARHAGPGRAFVDWLVHELELLGVSIETNISAGRLGELIESHTTVVQATGSRRGTPDYTNEAGADVLDIADVRTGKAKLPEQGTIVILDPIGGPIGVSLAEELGARAVLVTPDNIAGNELSRTGDLAPANVRLAQQGVSVRRRSIVRTVERTPNGFGVRVQDRFSGDVDVIEAAAVVDAGFRLPAETITDANGQIVGVAIGDCVAPRTILEAVLEARRAALAI
ncbi:MAG: hypothetical protein RL391_1753 [Actinomycetota bacterium]|jgi:2,4-dienoyl-CoA reductase (NADPH2)